MAATGTAPIRNPSALAQPTIHCFLILPRIMKMGHKRPREAAEMNKTLFLLQNTALALTLTVLLLDAVNAAEPEPSGPRTEVWLALTSWQAQKDLRPVAGGSFKSVGYGLGASAHWPLASLASADLMLGIEGAVMATDSDIPVFFDELLARDAYLAASVKWSLRNVRSLSVDLGAAYHLLDIAQLETDYYGAIEFQSWEETAFGPFLGLTWDLGSAGSGATIGLHAHFLDFGTVRDEDVLLSAVLGQNAGELDGPLIVLRIGYRWR